MSHEIDSESQIIADTRDYFLKLISEGTPIQPFFPQHVEKVQDWAQRILSFYPEADREIVLLSVWLHDIGQADGKYYEDHSVKSEVETRNFLFGKGYPKERAEQIAHCVRSHRCRDVQPETLEARILVAADSASHMTDFVYIIMLGQNHLSKQDVLDKLDRDYRDTDIYLPADLKPEVQKLYEAWKGLITAFPK
jgi:HD superfamily phosphodiesterase